MADILLIGQILIGPAQPGMVAALAARGLRLVDAPSPSCRAALVILPGIPAPALPYLALAQTETGVIAALDNGADDAAGADTGAALIAARLVALVRRRPVAPVLALGDLLIDRVERRVTRQGRSIALLPREYEVLLELVRHAGSVVTRAALRQAVWRMDFDPGTNVIEVHVSRLRAKLDGGFAAPMLYTEKGLGYRLIAAQSPIAAATLAG